MPEGERTMGDGAASAPAFLPLEADAHQKSKRKQQAIGSRLSEFDAAGKRKSAVLYIGRIPHGFYEDQMRGYFSQFGDVKRLRLSRNKKSGKSKHYAFVEFESAEVAEIVAENMDNYLMFGRIVQVKIVPPEKIHPSLWDGANRKYIVRKTGLLARKLHNQDKSLEKRKVLVEKYARKDRKRREKLKELGYEYPGIESSLLGSTKVIFETS